VLFSLAHLTLLDCSPPELTEIAARAGFDFVSLRLIPFGQPAEPRHQVATDRALLARTRRALESTGVRLLDIELARIYPDVNIREYLPALECAAELGGRHVLTSAWCSDSSFIVDRFGELCELARPLGLTIDLEFVSYAGVRTLSQAAQIVRASGCANAGICVDTLHFDRSAGDAADLARLPTEWFHYAQICDAPAEFDRDEDDQRRVAREARLFLGEGGIDVRGILANLPPVPYSIELPNTTRRRALGSQEFARRCLSTAKRYLTRPPDLSRPPGGTRAEARPSA